MKKIATINGVVVKGVLMGKKIGFPTINVDFIETDISFGVYISLVETPLGVYKGALHYGPRAVLGITEPCLEVHLLDFSGDLYGQKVVVHIYDKIRDTQSFDSLDSLKRQIRLDVESVRDAEVVL